MITESMIRKACDELANTLIKKNQDYGNSVQEQFEEYGLTSINIRLDDKLRRLKRLAKHDNLVKSESIEDTLMDGAGYNILGLLCVIYKKENEAFQDMIVDQIDTRGGLVRNINFE